MNQIVIKRIISVIQNLVNAKGIKIDLTPEFIEIIVRFNENAEIRTNVEFAKQLESIWDILTNKKDFVNQYNELKKALLAKRQLRKEEIKMQAITDPQT